MSSQAQFNKLLSNEKSIISGGRCYINITLTGEIDLSELKGRGIKELWFAKGGITQLYNFPDGINRLVIRENHLSNIPTNELANLAILDAESNNISEIDLSNMPNLTYANLAKNKIRHIGKLPPKLVELNVNYNPDLKSIDLEGADACKKVSSLGDHLCTNQKITVYGANKHCNIVVNNGARIRGGAPPIGRTEYAASDAILYHDPNEAFDEYYKLKSEYEDSIKKAIRKIKNTEKMPRSEQIKRARQFVPKCINCGRIGGTHFIRNTDALLLASCAVSTSPCNLNIKIRLGDNMETLETIDYFEENRKQIKQDIIKLKLDTLFNYISEADSVKTFTELTTKLNNPVITKQLSEYKQFYELQKNNPETNRLIRNTMDGIYHKMADIRQILIEYRKNGENPNLLNDIGKMLVEIDTDNKMVRRLKYPIIEMIEDRKGVAVLKQKMVDLQSFIEPEVLRFSYENANNLELDKKGYVANSPEYNPSSPHYVANSPDYNPSSPHYVANSPEYNPSSPHYVENQDEYTISGNNITWSNTDYNSVWWGLTQKYREVLSKDPEWMKDTITYLVESAKNPNERPKLLMPKNIKMPPSVLEDNQLDFENDIINGIVSSLQPIQREILVDELQKTENPSQEDLKPFYSMLNSMLEKSVGFTGFRINPISNKPK